MVRFEVLTATSMKMVTSQKTAIFSKRPIALLSYLTTLCRWYANDRMMANWQGTVVAYFKAFSCLSPEEQ
jgi:hypothetical protein